MCSGNMRSVYADLSPALEVTSKPIGIFNVDVGGYSLGKSISDAKSSNTTGANSSYDKSRRRNGRRREQRGLT